MLKLASTQTHFALAMLAAVGLAACGGDEADDGNGNNGGSGGGGGSGTGSGVLVSDFDTANPDNMYDGYSENKALGWRIAWFTYSDKSAGSMIFPTEGAAFQATMDASRPAGEQYVAKTSGMGFSTWGAGMGFNFAVNGPGVAPNMVDLSAYKGIRFMMKVTNPALNGTVSVKLVDFDHAEVVNGGGCTIKTELGTLGQCNNNFSFALTNGSSEWKQFSVAFSELSRDTTWGQQYPMDLKEVIGFQFQVPQNGTFDFAVDEFELTQ